MRATLLFVTLALLWAGADQARAGFKPKLTHLSDLEMDLTHWGDLVSPAPAPPANPPSLDAVLTVGSGSSGDFDSGAGSSTIGDNGPFVPMSGPQPSGGGLPVGTFGGLGPEAAAAPAPGGLILGGLGIVGLVGYGRWRRPAA